MPRVLLFGGAWIIFVAALTAVAIGLPARQPMSPPARTADLAPPPPPPRAGMRFPGWTVTRAYSAHHMMVVEVEADRLTDDLKIAAQIVEPLRARYDEALIYFRLPGQRNDDLPPRRVQWTRRGGYVESVYAR